MDPRPITLFAIPKRFQGHTNVIQRNAILSWTRLQPKPQIILFGDDEGTKEIADELSIEYVEMVARNQHGTPLVSDLFQQAQRQASGEILCYVNADIILMDDFSACVRNMKSKHFLLVSHRWDLDITELIDFNTADWKDSLRRDIAALGKQHASTGIDIFVFSRGLFLDIPPFAIGRTAWDNWLIYKARLHHARVIDATETLTLVHQNHDYSHHKQGAEGVWHGPEAQENLRLAGGYPNLFTLEDVNYRLTKDGLKRIYWTSDRLDRELLIQNMIRPWLRPGLRLFTHIRAITPKWVKTYLKKEWEKKQSQSSA